MYKQRVPFSRADVDDMSDSEFEVAMSGLLDKGLVEKLIINGIEHYLLTEIGAEVGAHLNSEPSTRN